MLSLFLLENGSALINSLPQFSKSFWTSEFIVFEMNSRLSSVRRPGAVSVDTSSGKNRAAKKSFFMTYSHCVDHSGRNRYVDDCFQPNGKVFHDPILSIAVCWVQADPHRTGSNTNLEWNGKRRSIERSK